MSDQLTGVSGFAADVLARLGELGLALLLALDNVFPPIPSEVVLTLAGILTAQGRLSLVLVLAAATLSSVLSAQLLYELGARLPHERLVGLVRRTPTLAEGDLDRAEAWFRRHGGRSVLIGRCVPVVRSLVSVPAGVTRMPRGRFLALTALGSGVWNTGFVLLGYFAGRTVSLQLVGRVMDVVVLGLGVALVAALVRHVVHRRQERVPH